MQIPRRSLLLHPLFLTSLILLFANDNYWKYDYPGWVTGKLSDVTGLFVFVIFLRAILPNRKRFIAIFTVLFFWWWKSALSGFAISWANEYLHLPVQRTIDYTDLIALAIIPFALRLPAYQYKITGFNKVVKPLAFLFSLHVICATTMYQAGYITPENQLILDKTYKTRLTQEQILEKLDSLHIPYQYDSVEMYPAVTRNVYLKINHEGDSATEWLPANELQNPTLYYRYVSEPFYKISSFVLEQDTIHNIKFRIQNLGKKRMIEVISVETPQSMRLGYYVQPHLYKKYRAMVKTMLLE